MLRGRLMRLIRWKRTPSWISALAFVFFWVGSAWFLYNILVFGQVPARGQGWMPFIWFFPPHIVLLLMAILFFFFPFFYLWNEVIPRDADIKILFREKLRRFKSQSSDNQQPKSERPKLANPERTRPWTPSDQSQNDRNWQVRNGHDH
jgi:glucan phosphoethanolaminetransferase (alkaline phosphatase superfamily)